MTLKHLLPLAILTVALSTRADSPAPKPKPEDDKPADAKPPTVKLDTTTPAPADPKHANHAKKEQPAKISPEAQAELAKVTAAYKKLTALELTGTLTRETDTGSDTAKHTAAITAAFRAPNQFRHEIKDAANNATAADMLVGSTGQKVFAYRPARNDYKSADAPKDRVPSARIPQPARSLLEQQNPGLMCAIVDDAGQFLVEGMKEVSREPDLTLNGKRATVLAFKSDQVDYKVLLDPQTHLVRQVVVDSRRLLTSAGLDDARKDQITYDYATINPAAAPKPESFAWATPDGAKDAAAAASEEADATALVNEEAPDFTLKGMDDKPVALADTRGSVVILDFWATWCGPCRASLPGLNKLHKELAPKGLQTFAVDLEEPKDTIRPVAAKLCPDLTVLLDEDSAVAKKYGVSGIPQTVVIGRDGKVKKVFVGSGNEAKIRAAVESLLDEK